MVLVFMDHLHMEDTIKTWRMITSTQQQRYFWENCGENDCTKGGKHNKGRIDPVLKLYYNCPMMYTRNTDVMSGQANGSCVYVEGVYLKGGEAPFDLALQYMQVR